MHADASPAVLAYRMQLAVWDMEGRLGVKAAFRFPMYKELMWHAAQHYLSRAQAAIRQGRHPAIAIKSHFEAIPWCSMEVVRSIL